MPYYKFTDSRYMNNLLIGGEFRFTHLSYYRLLESVLGDASIGDANDGRVVTFIDKIDTRTDKTKKAVARLKEIGIETNDRLNVVIENTTFAQTIDCFLFCFSEGHIHDLIRNSGLPYDGCIEIKNLEYLVKSIYLLGLIDGKPVQNHFDVQAGRVAYDVSEPDNASRPISSPDPFRKGPRYSSQNEFRIVLYPKTNWAVNRHVVTITIRHPENFLAECFRDGPLERISQQTAEDRQNEAELTLSLKNSLSALQALQSIPRHSLPGSTIQNDDEIHTAILPIRTKIASSYLSLRILLNQKEPMLDSHLIRDPPHLTGLLCSLRQFLDSLRRQPGGAGCGAAGGE